MDVENFGLVDNAQTAWAVLPEVKGADLDLLFVDMATYATSSTFGVICREVNVPDRAGGVAAAGRHGLPERDDAHAVVQRRLLFRAGVHGRRRSVWQARAARDSGPREQRSRRPTPNWSVGATSPRCCTVSRKGRVGPDGARARVDVRHARRPVRGHRRVRLPRAAAGAPRSAAPLPGGRPGGGRSQAED